MLDNIRSFTAISNGADIEMIQRWDRRLGQYARASSLNHLAGQLAPIEIGVIVNNRTYLFLTEYENRGTAVGGTGTDQQGNRTIAC